MFQNLRKVLYQYVAKNHDDFLFLFIYFQKLINSTRGLKGKFQSSIIPFFVLVVVSIVQSINNTNERTKFMNE